jgi:hypothetical protein
MRTAFCITCGLLALLPTGGAQAQTTLAGKQQCAKPDPNYTLPVGDHAKHTMSLSGLKCTWSEGDIAGGRLTDEADTYTSDISGNLSRDLVYGVGSVASGDKYFIRYAVTTRLKDGAPVRAQCTWTFAGGTGKLKGLSGKGTCKGTFSADGTGSWDIQGDYLIQPTAKTK